MLGLLLALLMWLGGFWIGQVYVCHKVYDRMIKGLAEFPASAPPEAGMGYVLAQSEVDEVVRPPDLASRLARGTVFKKVRIVGKPSDG